MIGILGGPFIGGGAVDPGKGESAVDARLDESAGDPWLAIAVIPSCALVSTTPVSL